MFKRRKDCDGETGVDLGNANSVAECAQKCKEADKCTVFQYGIEGTSKAKYCYNMRMFTPSCSGGWQDDDYNVYQLQGMFLSIFSNLPKEYYLLYNLFTSINTIYLYLGMCNFEAIPSSSCPSSINDNTVPACSTKRYHSETSFCEGDSGDTPGTNDSENNCGDGDDVYKCIRGNQTNSNHMIIEII